MMVGLTRTGRLEIEAVDFTTIVVAPTSDGRMTKVKGFVERRLRHRNAVSQVIERARRRGISAWVGPKEIVKRAILLNDDDDVLDRCGRRRWTRRGCVCRQRRRCIRRL